MTNRSENNDSTQFQENVRRLAGLSEVPAVFQDPASLVTYLKDNALSFTLICFS